MVIGVHVPAEPLGRERGDDLVGVHVGGRTGTRLEDVHREVRVPATRGDLARRFLDGLGHVLVDHPSFALTLAAAP